jgi:hypothetical protein
MAYQPSQKPYVHQIEAVRRARGRTAFAYLMETGVGKSGAILDEFGEMEAAGEVQDLLIIAPSGCYSNWIDDKSELQLSEFKARLSLDLYSRLVATRWVSGGNITEKRAIEKLLKTADRPRAMIMNIEALSMVKKARDACAEFIGGGRRALIVIDESTTIRNNSERTKAIRRFAAKATYRRIASGLVAPKSPLDLFYQFEFLDHRILGFINFYAFRARYAVIRQEMFGGRSVPIVVGYRNTEELQGKIAPHSFRCLKEDCLDLPPKVYQTCEVELTDEQRRIYKQIKEEAQAELGNGAYVSATAVMTQLLRMHQVLCGYVVDEMGNKHDVPNRRIAALMDVLQEHQGKAIIWVAYEHSLHAIAMALAQEFGPNSVARFWGGNYNTRSEDERRFLGDQACRFMVSTPAAGGRGNTWVEADLTIFFSNSFDLEHRLQAEDRNHRAGQSRSVTYIDLVAPGTIDSKIIKALRKKINIASQVQGDGWKSWVI